MAHAGGSCDPALAGAGTRLTLTTTPDPRDEATPPSEDESTTANSRPEAEPGPDPEPEPEPGEQSAAPGVSEAVGLALGAVVIAVLAAILLYVGSFLFFGELLFGSMGWGIIHGTLLAAAVVGFVAINLAGGQVGRYGWGAAIGVAVAVVFAAVLLSNVGNTGGEAIKDRLSDTFVTEDLPFGEAWLVTLSGLVLGGLVALIIAAVIGWRSQLRGGALIGASVAGFLLGGFVGAIWLSTRYAAPDGVLGLAITIGFLTWIIAGAILAARAGFDPEARYANLVPRESIAAFEQTKDFMSEQWERQKNRMLGR
jgi:hypothetical protein